MQAVFAVCVDIPRFLKITNADALPQKMYSVVKIADPAAITSVFDLFYPEKRDMIVPKKMNNARFPAHTPIPDISF